MCLIPIAPQIHNASTSITTATPPPPDHSVGASFCLSKFRVLAITFLVLGVLLLISGALFLTLGISGVSLGVGLGLSALGSVLVISGFLLLLERREVSGVGLEGIPTGIPVGPSAEPSSEEIQKKQKAKQILDQLPQELDQLDTDIQHVLSCLGKLKDLKCKDRGLLKDAKEKLQVFDFVWKDMMMEFVELQQVMDQESRYLEGLIHEVQSIAHKLFVDDVNIRSHLGESCGYLPSEDVRGELLKRFAKEVVARFMKVTRDIRKIAMAFNKNAYGAAKNAFDKAFGSLETCLYKSLTKSYRDTFCDYKRAKILPDENNSARAEQRFREVKDHWEDLKETVFWVKEDGRIDIEVLTAVGGWPDRYPEHLILEKRKDKVMSHQLWEATMRVKEAEVTYSVARVAFEKDGSQQNQKKFQEKTKERLRCLKDLRDQECHRAQERLEKLTALYPEVSVSVVETERERKFNLEKAYGNLEERYQSVVQDQEDYWTEQKNREAEFRAKGTKVRSMEEVAEHLQILENLLEDCYKRLSKAETFALGVEREATEEIEYTILSDAANRLKVLCEDIEDTLPRVEEIEMMLRMAERPLHPIKQAFTKAFVQYNRCKERLAKVEPYYKESPAYVNSEERLQSLDQASQCIQRVPKGFKFRNGSMYI
ncbi:Uncharacterized protein BN1224_Wien1_A_00470 [Chlamydia pneumoniae]|uniref:DUF1978 domain-containing protein n=1 Tax=Chlamydia pneumoniae TaxID=83558 RepID=A0A0F7XNB8_CHLPN|nr:DUF1978 domain-containing protein [Chlamydia pneumoniae]CRI32540.1 Uncharacterized protein BN1224_Wien1_A_00470 [Chlamydia pneumoniae]CRI52322.1 Uncharacterized protein BN1224_Wien2_B_00330 [Chlamydia pneumoniae]